MPYVDGYVLPVPKKSLSAYRRLAAKAGKVWREHGALEYVECVADDIYPKRMIFRSFGISSVRDLSMMLLGKIRYIRVTMRLIFPSNIIEISRTAERQNATN